MATPIQSQESQSFAAALMRESETAGQLAATLVSTWQDIDVVLSPIIGQRGVAMLYARSLHLIAPAHPWLVDIYEGSQTAMDLAALESVVAQQSSAAAAAAGGVLLQTFHELLSSLIGSSLTERLLQTVWDTFSSGAPAQDPTS